MAASIRIQPSDFVMPTGPAVVFVKIDRQAFQHLAPSMNPLTDEDSLSTVLKKGRPAEAYAIRQLSNLLFGDEIEPSVTSFVRPEFRVRRPEESERLHLARWACFYWLGSPAGEDVSAALVELTSAVEPVDNHLDFHAVKVADENHRVDSITHIFHCEVKRAEAWAQERAQKQAQEQTQDQAQAQAQAAL